MKLPNKEDVAVSDEQSFWTTQEKRFFEDLKKIECSKMNFAEKKYYSKIAMFMFDKTEFYEYVESISEILWTKKH